MTQSTDIQNVLLVTADSVRADCCGFINDDVDTTPNMSNLASESLIFENATSPGPRTPSSMPLIISGEFYRENDEANDNTHRLDRIADHIQRYNTVSDRLRSKGYTTAAITANPWTTRATRFDEQFDEFHEIGSGYSKSDSEDTGSSSGPLQGILEHGRQWAKKTDWFSQWPMFFDDVRDLVTTLNEPWFVWVFLLDTHSPYMIPKKYRDEVSTAGMYYSALRYNINVMRGDRVNTLPPHLDKRLQASYRDSIRSVDAFVGAVCEEIDFNDTALVFHSDHGEAFGEHGTYGHQEALYEENIRVPLLIRTQNPSERISTPLSLIHLPRIVEDIATGTTLDSTRYTEQFPVSKTEYGETIAFGGRQWKFISDGKNSELYDIIDDPKEVNDVSEERESLTNLFEAYYDLVMQDQWERESIATEITELIGEEEI